MRSKSLGFFISLIICAMPASAYRTSAWVSTWDPNGITSMQRNAGKLTESNPGWYTVNADGTIATKPGAENPAHRAAMAGTQLMPTIKNNGAGDFDGALVARIVASPDLRERHAEAIATLVVQKAYDGIDIDYESLPASARTDFSTFIQLLATKLHQSRKRLAVAVHAKTSDFGNWDGSASQDWRAIGAAADNMKIMAYDKHYSGSVAGPIAPLDWLDAVVTYAKTVVPAGKVIVGLPWYGYDWQATTARSLTYQEAIDLAAAQGATVTRDASGEATFTYAGRTVFFNDALAYQKKIDLLMAKHATIGGVAAWRAGSEDPALWPTVAKLMTGVTSGSSGAAPVQESFAINGVAAIAAVAGKQTTASFSITGINGFSGTAAATVEALTPFAGTLSFDNASARVGAPAIVRIAPATNALGSYSIRIRMTAAGIATQEVTATINVTAPPVVGTFSVDTTATLSTTRGTVVTLPVSVRSISGFASTVAMTAEVLDGLGATATLGNRLVAAGQSTWVAIQIPESATAGTYRVRLTGSSDGVTREIVVQVTVTAQGRRRSSGR